MTAITYFSSLYVAHGKRVAVRWSTLFARFERASVFARKDQAPRWSAATFLGDRRSLANLETIGALVFDLDRGDNDVSPHVVEQELGDLCGFVHSTWSSTSDAPRSRLILVTDRPMTGAEYPRVFRFAAARIDRSFPDAIDYGAADAAHVWAVPAIDTDPRHYKFAHLRGAMVAVDEALAAIPEHVPEALEPARELPSQDLGRRLYRASRWLACVPGAIAGSGGHATTFRAALGLVRGFALPAEDALRLLADEYNPRCSPAWDLKALRHKIQSAAQRARLADGYLLRDRRSA